MSSRHLRCNLHFFTFPDLILLAYCYFAASAIESVRHSASMCCGVSMDGFSYEGNGAVLSLVIKKGMLLEWRQCRSVTPPLPSTAKTVHSYCGVSLVVSRASSWPRNPDLIPVSTNFLLEHLLFKILLNVRALILGWRKKITLSFAALTSSTKHSIWTKTSR